MSEVREVIDDREQDRQWLVDRGWEEVTPDTVGLNIIGKYKRFSLLLDAGFYLTAGSSDFAINCGCQVLSRDLVVEIEKGLG